MYLLKTKDKNGLYIDSAGERYEICVARRIRTQNGINAGYEEYPALEDALRAWGLCVVESTEDFNLPAAPDFGLHRQ